MSENARKPSIRFAGFDDAWEQRKLGDIVDRVTRKNTNLQSSLPLTISAQYGLVDQISYFNNRVASQNVSGYYLIKQGEFAYNKSSSEGFPFGAVKRLDGYEMGVLSTLYIVFVLKPNAVNSQFLVSYYDTYNWHKQVSMRAAEGARNHGLLNISTEDFFDTELIIPQDKDEQERIGQMLLNLDNLITLHQRKYDKLVSVKKSMLEKMFPKNDSNIPEIRFSGFTDPWEQRKLIDIVDRITETSNKIGLPRVEYEDINSGLGTLNKDLSGKYSNKQGVLFRADDVLFGKLRPYLKNWLIADFSGIAVGDFWVLRGFETDSSFIYTLIQSDVFDKVANQSTGTKMPRADWSLVSNAYFEVPHSKAEQHQIGTFFHQLDNLITLHQRKLEKLKNIKKSMLEKMFV